jgi:hypothetical protein
MWVCPGPGRDRKSDRCVLEATMRDPATGGPGARLATGSKGQGNDGVGAQSHTHFRPGATASSEAPLTSERSRAKGHPRQEL